MNEIWEHRRRLIIASSGGGNIIPSFTGNYELFGDATQGYMRLLSDGEITCNGVYDLCLVGGGYKGGLDAKKANGGRGGNVLNTFGRELKGLFAITIAPQTTGNTPDNTLFGSLSSANGVAGGNAGTVPTTGNNGNNGKDGIYIFDDETFGKIAGGGGSGGYAQGYSTTDRAGGVGGAVGGGAGGNVDTNRKRYKEDGEYYYEYYCKKYDGSDGTPNTGGGGGGGGYSTSFIVERQSISGKGGSGVIYIRWGY